MEIPYIIIKESESLPEIVDIMSKLNNCFKKWTNDHYANCYCAVGMSDYIFLRTKKGQTKLSYASLLNIYHGTDSGSGYKKFKEGNIKINIESGDIMLKYVLSMFKVKNLSERSLRAFVPFCKSITNYDHDKFLNNFKRSLPVMDDCFETTQFYNKFVEIYNKK